MESECLSKECFGPFHISRGTESDIDEIPIGINAPIEITPGACDLNISFIYKPYTAYFSPPFSSNLFGKMREIFFFPIPNSFMCKREATDQKNLGNISKTEFIPDSQEQSLENNVGWNFYKIEGGTCTFVVGPTTFLAAKS